VFVKIKDERAVGDDEEFFLAEPAAVFDRSPMELAAESGIVNDG
jgi:hypothetical protein